MNGRIHALGTPSVGKKRRYPGGMGLGGPQSRSGHDGKEKKVPSPTGNRTSIVQPLASHYTDWATLALRTDNCILKMCHNIKKGTSKQQYEKNGFLTKL
jgi:hypothetical protein